MALSGITFQDRSWQIVSDDDLPLTGPPGGSVRYIFPGERLLMADSDNDLSLSGLPGGSVKYIIPGEGLLVEDSDELPLSGPPGGSVRYVYHSRRRTACGG